MGIFRAHTKYCSKLVMTTLHKLQLFYPEKIPWDLITPGQILSLISKQDINEKHTSSSPHAS